MDMDPFIAYELVIEELTESKHKIKVTLTQALDRIKRAYPNDFIVDDFLSSFALALHHNGVIMAPTNAEVFLLDSRIHEETLRNYRMVDLLRAVQSFMVVRRDFHKTTSLKVVR